MCDKEKYEHNWLEGLFEWTGVKNNSYDLRN